MQHILSSYLTALEKRGAVFKEYVDTIPCIIHHVNERALKENFRQFGAPSSVILENSCCQTFVYKFI